MRFVFIFISCYLFTYDIFKDVNCDRQFDCIDRFAIHLFGSNYEYPNFGKTYTERFNTCNKMANSSVAQITNYTIGCLARIGRN